MLAYYNERDEANKRSWSMWDQCGMRFRENRCDVGGRIPLHAHSYAHVAAVWGRFEMTVIDGEGIKTTTTVENALVEVPMWHQHTFVFLGTEGQGVVQCFWPIGADGAAL